MLLAGIDIGTTTISAVVLDEAQERVLESRTVANGSFLRTGQEWERVQDAVWIAETAQEVLDDLLARYPKVQGIGLTGQMHGIVYVDAEGKACSPLFTWQDGRGNQEEERGTLTEEIRNKTGRRTATGFGLVTHLYQQRHCMIPQKAVKICTIPDYFGMRITGKKEPLMHVSMAASLGLFRSQELAFDREALSAMEMETSFLPMLTSKFEMLGDYKDIPVFVPIGDNQASFLGAVGRKTNVPLLNVGTGSQISVLSARYFEAEGIEARPLCEGWYLLVGSGLCGGRAYAILERFFRRYVEAAGFGTKDQYEVLGALAESALKAGVLDRPAVDTRFQGTRENPLLRGAIQNLNEDNFTPENLAYGVLEGIAGELHDYFETIRKGTGIHADRLIASGNGVRRNHVLQEVFSRMFKAQLELARYQEEAACGAALTVKAASD